MEKKIKEDHYVAFIKFYIRIYKKRHWGGVFLGKLLFWVNRLVFSCDIPPTVEIGNNIHLPHFGMGVTIHPWAKIGNNVRIYQQVTIGARGKQQTGRIGNNVLIGAGAKILGEVNIGNNVKIGANCVVLTDVPDGCTIVGVPGKIVKSPKTSKDQKVIE